MIVHRWRLSAVVTTLASRILGRPNRISRLQAGRDYT
jgi:hypothetical protein